MNMTKQMKMVFEYLKAHKKATGAQLWRACGVISYTKVISRLRGVLPEMGYTIYGEKKPVNTRFYGKVYVNEYTLVKINKKRK